MPYLSSRNIITCNLNVDKEDVNESIEYGTIIEKYLMVQLGLIPNFQHNALKWDVNSVPIVKFYRALDTGKTNPTNDEIQEAAMHTK